MKEGIGKEIWKFSGYIHKKGSMAQNKLFHTNIFSSIIAAILKMICDHYQPSKTLAYWDLFDEKKMTK